MILLRLTILDQVKWTRKKEQQLNIQKIVLLYIFTHIDFKAQHLKYVINKNMCLLENIQFYGIVNKCLSGRFL